jgi:hypothetical protein
MLSVVRSVGATATNGALVLYVANSYGLFTDVFAGAFQILDSTGTQIFPGSGRQTLDVSTATPAGNHLGLGRYVAVWDSSASAVGQYTIRWFFTRVSGGTEETFDEEFEIVTAAYKGSNYCTVYDLRDEGLLSSVKTDAQCQAAIVRAGRYIEMYTGRTFGPKFKTIDVDGSGGRAVQFEEPIIGIDSLYLSFVTNFTAQDLLIPSEALKVYNRHLTQGLSEPDDRENPKLEFVHGADLAGVNYYESGTGYVLYQLMFPNGRQNLRAMGAFGYTDRNPTATPGAGAGVVPEMVREAAKLLVFRNLGSMASGDRTTSYIQSRIYSETTRDQSYQATATWLKGAFTGDSAIDDILATYSRPAQFGAA